MNTVKITQSASCCLTPTQLPLALEAQERTGVEKETEREKSGEKAIRHKGEWGESIPCGDRSEGKRLKCERERVEDQ